MEATKVTYLIRLASEKPGIPPSEREPIVGKWYCEMELVDDHFRNQQYERGGQLGRYEGDGIFVDEDGEGGYQEVSMHDEGDYLQEQY